MDSYKFKFKKKKLTMKTGTSFQSKTEIDKRQVQLTFW